jgi:hypothetical protein
VEAARAVRLFLLQVSLRVRSGVESSHLAAGEHHADEVGLYKSNSV